jgi:oxygen-independent coproporphyrinogen III oxidase
MRSVYVHIPFCLSKCRYCGFNSVPVSDVTVLESYCGALVAEIMNNDTGIQSPLSETMYFGGGTPSILSLAQIGRILDALGRAARIGPSTELTIEANPETLTSAKLQGLRGLGFNRLSLGIQSFDDRLLRLMGRPHDSAQAATAYFLAREAGFANIGLDLIFALPGQTLQQWEADLDRAVALRPEHVSLYSLSYEKNSEFGILNSKGKIHPVSEDLETDMYLAAIAAMRAAGYGHYEVSNFAKAGFRSRHNLNYWRCGDYRGFGAGAHSHEGDKRWANRTVPADYIDASEAGRPLAGFEETLTRDQQLFEAVFLGLRMVEGIDIAAFGSQWGVSPLARLPEVWEDLERNGLLAVTEGNIRLTERGLLLSDSVLAKLAP